MCNNSGYGVRSDAASATSFKGTVGKTAPDRFKRDFTTTGPNQKWVTDVTEFRVGDRKVSLSTVMDLFCRAIIGHRIGISPNPKLTNSSLREALTKLGPGQKPIVHSDSETVCAGVFRFLDRHRNGDGDGVPSVPDPHSDRRSCVFPWICRFLGTPGEALRLTVGVT